VGNRTRKNRLALRGLVGVWGCESSDHIKGLPVIIGAEGVERVVEIALDTAEKAMFDKSVSAVRGLIDAMRKIQRGDKL
jgi:malate/lactate dehydrogenase